MEGAPVDKSELHDMSIILSRQDYTKMFRDEYLDNQSINTRKRLQ